MKCVLPGNNVKVFGRAIHCLSKIGEDLYIEPLDSGLALRTVNSSRSAYACYLFAPVFFMQYNANTLKKTNATEDGGDEEEEDDSFRCRITMKSCLAVFKSLSTLEKTVDKCRISLDAKECRLIFQLHCKHGIVKTYNLTYQETETLQAVFSKDLCPNHIVADAKDLCDVVSNFQTSQEEMSLSVNPQQVSFKNYVDDEPDPSKVLHSEMFLSPQEFEDYTIGVDTEVTFCLKELRAILAFADGAGLPISLHFETTGKPIVFSIFGENILEATFVLATLADNVPSSQVSVSCSGQQSSITQHSRISNARKHARSQQARNTSTHSRTRFDLQRLPNGQHQPGYKPSTSRVTGTVGDTSAMDVEFPDDIMLAAEDAAMDRLSQQENNSQKQQENINSKTKNQKNQENMSDENDPDRTQGDLSPSPVIPVIQNNRPKIARPTLRLSPEPQQVTVDVHREDEDVAEVSMTKQNTTLLSNFDEDEIGDDERVGMDADAGDTSIVQDLDGPSDNEDYDFIPGTPPSKKFKSMFFGASQSQCESQVSVSTRQRQTAAVLAEDTDDESD